MPELPKCDVEVQYILDGGALLQLIPWPRGATFAAIIRSYVQFVQHRFQNATVVFDGYNSGPSTKDVTHIRRAKGKCSPEVVFKPEMSLQARKDVFLSNKKNKQRFINLLSEALAANLCPTVCADGDADCMIVAQALESSKTQVTIVVGDDTDLLVLLCHHASDNHRDIFLEPSHRTSTKTVKLWNIRHTRCLGSLCQVLPVIHAVSGCDTTSRPFGVGKRSAFRKFQRSKELKSLASMFLTDCTPSNSTEAGEKILVSLYDGTSPDCLDDLRYNMFCTKVAGGTSFLQMHCLPPTSAAAKYHSLRVYLQVQEWAGTVLEPQDWGWKTAGDNLVPCTTDLPPAPSKLLSVIRCNCKSDCDTKRCSCRKHGLDCSSVCGECHGLECSNAYVMCADENDTDD